MSRTIEIVGAGAVGLFAARELASRGANVIVLERGRIGSGASGAAVGVLQAPNWSRSSFARLSRAGFEAYSEQVDDLVRETGVDLEYRQCGGVFLYDEAPRDPRRVTERWEKAGVCAKWCDRSRLEALIPGYGGSPSIGLEIDREAVLRPSALLEALAVSCRARGVEIVEECGDVKVTTDDDGRARVLVERSDLRRGVATVVVTGGSWSQVITDPLPGRFVDILPIRGQAMSLRHPSPACVVHFTVDDEESAYYLIPRDAGELWVGSTVEEVGLDDSTTTKGREELLGAARRVLPSLGSSDVLRQWAGLRPKAMRLGGPFIGAWPGVDNLWVAAGHYKTGIMQSPATARILARAILDGEEIDPGFALLDDSSTSA